MSSAVETLGKYVIRRQLGRGAMGTVYEGFDPIIERVVAIKTVRLPEPGDEETVEEIARFRREAQAAGRLTHPNIVGVFDYGETTDLAYIVMEYVDGPPLKTLLDKNERFPLPQIVRIMEDLCAGLQFSHERGVVHRDIKPANLMLTQAGQAKIADFGIARIESSSMTQAGTVLGTPAYMSPEQFMGQVVDSRTDIYSSGVLLYQLLTGERPFDGSMSAIMHKALNTDAPLPSQISVTAPRPFDTVVRRAMAKRPDDRYASAADFIAAIRTAATAPSPASIEEDNTEATIIAAPNRTAAPVQTRIDPLATPAPPAPAPTSAVLPPPPAKSAGKGLLIGGGLAGLARVLGGIGYFVLAGGPKTPVQEPVKPRIEPKPVERESGPFDKPTEPAKPIETAKPLEALPAEPSNPVTEAKPAETPPPARTDVPVRPAVDPNDVIRAETAAFLANVSCALVQGDVRDGVVHLNGLGGAAAIDAIARKLGASGTAMPSPRLTQVATVYCDWLNTLRPVAPAFGDNGPRLGLRLADDPAWLVKDDYIRPRLTMADFRGEIRVDYIDHAGNVQHLYPQVSEPRGKVAGDMFRVFEPGDELVLGQHDANHPGWQVDEPYGTDVIIAVASEEPLFDRPRATNIEKAAVYLRDLRRALDGARTRRTRVTASVLPIETRMK